MKEPEVKIGIDKHTGEIKFSCDCPKPQRGRTQVICKDCAEFVKDIIMELFLFQDEDAPTEIPEEAPKVITSIPEKSETEKDPNVVINASGL